MAVKFFEPGIDGANPFKDYGTPACDNYQQVTLHVDGRQVTVPEGTSILRAAAIAGIEIPKLCATDSLQAFGACRVCLVEIEGAKGLPASCTTPVASDMVVITQSERLQTIRGHVLELYVSEHPLDCDICPSDKDCELQVVTKQIDVTGSRYDTRQTDHYGQAKDTSNPYFTFDPNTCIVCSRCVRACDEVQGSYAITLAGRGMDSAVNAGAGQSFMESECVSCGACVQACPTSALLENSIIQQGLPEYSVVTTCAYCGVGCNFEVQLQGDQVVNMEPYKGSPANRGHSCVKGRFAYGYATHKDRVTEPMIRNHIDEPWQKVSWDEAFSFTAKKLRGIQGKYGINSIGGITSSRCTNEETYLVQKMVRAVFGNNNVDTCARVCHSPTGYGLKQTLGESAGTQNFDSVAKSDVVIVMGANPTDAHPVFASRLKKRLREGAKLIVVDPRRIELVSSPHVKASYHLQLMPGSNVAFVNAMAHVIVSEGLEDKSFIAQRCEQPAYDEWWQFILEPENSPEATQGSTGIPADELRAAAQLFATGGNGAIYYGLGVTEHSQGSTTVMGIANLAMLTGNLGREGVGVNPLRGQNNVQGSCDMGSFPHELPGYRPVGDAEVRALFEERWQVHIQSEAGLRIPNMFDSAIDGSFKGLYVQGEDLAQSDPNTQHVEKALRSLECLVVQDIFFNETAKFAHVLLPGATFLEKDGTFTNAERRISPVRKVMEPLSGLADWQVTCELSKALGYHMNYSHPSEIMDEIAQLTPTFSGVSFEKLDLLGSIQWPCNDAAPTGTPTMHEEEFVRGKGLFAITQFVPTTEKVTRKFPLLLTTGRILSQYNVGAQTRRTNNVEWHDEDILEIHPFDAEDRGIEDGDWVSVTSRAGETALCAHWSIRVQSGVVYTTFHHPESGANVVTTDNSDWATNCPEYKVTAVQIKKVGNLSEWQKKHHKNDQKQKEMFAIGAQGIGGQAQ